MVGSMAWTLLGVFLRDTANGKVDEEYFDKLATPGGLAKKYLEATARSGHLPALWGDGIMGLNYQGQLTPDSFPIISASASVEVPFELLRRTWNPISHLATGKYDKLPNDAAALTRLLPGLNSPLGQGILNNTVFE